MYERDSTLITLLSFYASLSKCNVVLITVKIFAHVWETVIRLTCGSEIMDKYKIL